jgi:hypothetical protein
LGNKIEKNEMGEACSTYGEKRNIYWVLVGIPLRNRSLGRPRRRWYHNIKMDIQEVGCEGMDWIAFAQDGDRRRALVNAVMIFRFHKMRVLLNYLKTGLLLKKDCAACSIGYGIFVKLLINLPL